MSEAEAEDGTAQEYAPEWLPDSSSSACMLCERLFTYTRRRHHCRRCGWLVCNSCSLNTLGLGGSTEKQRVCDACYTTEVTKDEARLSRTLVQEREAAIVSQTSLISDNLIRVYFLDGTHRTIYYNESTTSLELSAKVSPYRIALFEVERDFREHHQFTFVPPEDKMVDVVSRWRLSGRVFSKLVVPLYSTQRTTTIMAVRASVDGHAHVDEGLLDDSPPGGGSDIALLPPSAPPPPVRWSFSADAGPFKSLATTTASSTNTGTATSCGTSDTTTTRSRSSSATPVSNNQVLPRRALTPPPTVLSTSTPRRRTLSAPTDIIALKERLHELRLAYQDLQRRHSVLRRQCRRLSDNHLMTSPIFEKAHLSNGQSRADDAVDRDAEEPSPVPSAAAAAAQGQTQRLASSSSFCVATGQTKQHDEQAVAREGKEEEVEREEQRRGSAGIGVRRDSFLLRDMGAAAEEGSSVFLGEQLDGQDGGVAREEAEEQDGGVREASMTTGAKGGGGAAAKEESGLSTGGEEAKALPIVNAGATDASLAITISRRISDVSALRHVPPAPAVTTATTHTHTQSTLSISALTARAAYKQRTSRMSSVLTDEESVSWVEQWSVNGAYKELYHGWLQKQSDVMGVWKHRYCVLCSDGFVRYYGSDVLLSRHPEPLTMVLIMPRGRVRLRADSTKNFSEWLEALDKEISRFRGVPQLDQSADNSFGIEEDSGGVLTARSLLQKLQDVDDLLTKYDHRLLDTILDHGRDDPDNFVRAHELAVKMDALHYKFTEMGPEWYERFTGWAIGRLKASLALPLKRADMLGVVLQCLATEGLLSHPQVVDAIKAAVRAYFHRARSGKPALHPSVMAKGFHDIDTSTDALATAAGDSHTEFTVPTVLRKARAVMEAVHLIAETWLPLFPREVNLAGVLMEELDAIVREDILSAYKEHQDSFSNEDVIRMLEYFHAAKQMVTEWFKEPDLAQALARLSHTFLDGFVVQAQTQMQEWMDRILSKVDFEKFDRPADTPTAELTTAALTHWPDDLSALLSQQLDVVTVRICGPPRTLAFKLIMATLADFRARLQQLVLSRQGQRSVAAMCAAVNDHGRFADMLEGSMPRFLERVDAVCVGDEGHGQQPRDTASHEIVEREVLAFTQASHQSLLELVEVVWRDVQEDMSSGLPLTWLTGAPCTMEIVEETLVDYVTEARVKLLMEHHYISLLSQLLKRLVKVYIEVLIKTSPRLKLDEDHVLTRRLRDDVKVLIRAFTYGGQGLPAPLVNKEVKAVVDVIALLDIDTGSIVEHTQHMLLPQFSVATSRQLVRAALTIRGREIAVQKDQIMEAVSAMKDEG